MNRFGLTITLIDWEEYVYLFQLQQMLIVRLYVISLRYNHELLSTLFYGGGGGGVIISVGFCSQSSWLQFLR